jgi:hypothetical protein
VQAVTSDFVDIIDVGPEDYLAVLVITTIQWPTVLMDWMNTWDVCYAGNYLVLRYPLLFSSDFSWLCWKTTASSEVHVYPEVPVTTHVTSFRRALTLFIGGKIDCKLREKFYLSLCSGSLLWNENRIESVIDPLVLACNANNSHFLWCFGG